MNIRKMKIRNCYIVLSLLFFSATLSVSAQSETDAFRLSQKALSGTARYESLAGAFTALGGDLSAIAYNPAATAVFRKSEFVYTMNTDSRDVRTSWYNQTNAKKKTDFHSGQLGYVASFFDKKRDYSFNFAFNMNQSYVYNRSIGISSRRPTEYSLADFTAKVTPDGFPQTDFFSRSNYDPYVDGAASWLAILGYQSGWTSARKDDMGPYYTSAFEYYDASAGRYLPYGPANSLLRFSESGYTRDYDFSFGFNYRDILYTGFSFKYMYNRMNYRSEYNEQFPFDDYLNLKNELSTRGDGFAFSLGLIALPVDGLRLGFALTTPTFYRFTDTYRAWGNSRYSQGLDKDGHLLPEKEWYYAASTPADAYYVYNLMTPTRLSFGIAYTYKNLGLISFDYELVPYGMMRISDDIGPFTLDNDAISKHYKAAHTMRVGLEVKPISRLALRVGGLWQTAPSRDVEGENYTFPTAGPKVRTAGTIPHYEFKSGANAFTCGIGYHFTKCFYMDFAYVYSTQKSKVYPFPTYCDNNGNAIIKTPDPIRINTHSNKATLSLGINF